MLAALASLAAAGAPPPAPVSAPYASEAGRIIGTELLDGRAFEIVTHLTDRIGRWADGRLHLQRGRLVEAGTPAMAAAR